MSKLSDQMELMARMAEDWGDSTSAMLSITVAMVLLKLKVTSVTVPLDDVRRITELYEIDRTYLDIEGRPHMVVTLIERTKDNG